MSVTVQEDVTVRMPFYNIADVFDNVGVLENVERNLLCLIKPTTITGIQLWSKLESAGDVTNPQIGTGGAEVGSPTYIPAKFGNGIYSDANNEGCTFPTAANGITIDKGTIEFWVKVYFDTNSSTSRYFFDCNLAGNGAIKLMYSGTFKDLYAEVKSGGSIVATATSTGISWSVGDVIHFAITWDKDGNDIGASKTLAIYMSDVEKASSTDTWASSALATNIFIGTKVDGSLESDAAIDNFKAYNVVMTDFSHKETEGVAAGPLEGVSLTEFIGTHLFSFVDVYDSPSLTEYLEVKYLGVRDIDIFDSVGVAEDVVSRLLSRVSVFDTSTLAELVSSKLSLGDVDVYDSVGVTEYIKSVLRLLLNVNDAAAVAEYVLALAVVAGISVSEVVSVLERIYLEWWLKITKDPTTWSDVDVDDVTWNDVPKPGDWNE